MTDFAVIGSESFSGRAFCEHLRYRAISWAGFSRKTGHDVRRPATIIDQIAEQRIPYVVNFAALNMVAESWHYAGDYYRTNVEGVASLADGLRESGIRRFVQVSTPEVYGTQHTALREGAPYGPSTPYAVSRAAADMHLSACQRAWGFPVCFTRTVNVYGPGQQLYRIVPKAIMCAMTGRKLQLHGGGFSERSFVHINDVADGIFSVAIDGADGATYHMATPRMISIRALVMMICEMMGVSFGDLVDEVEDRPGKDHAYLLDDSKIRDTLGWRDAVKLEDGITEVIAWARKHRTELEVMSLDYEHRT